MKFLLINPGPVDDEGRHYKLARELHFGATLPYLAALIPPPHEVRIVDDSVEEVDFAAPVEVVMLTAMTSRADRAYQIADGFRVRGRKVIMGGIHASLFPDEALSHVDAVVIGEAEPVMEELLADLQRGRVKEKYQGSGFPDLSGLPSPRFELMNPRNYLFNASPIQVMRGCPNRCRYCTVSMMLGARYRLRPIADVLRDLSRANRLVYFVDDNFFCDRDYALELFRAMKPLHKVFGLQGTIQATLDEELLRAGREAGLFAWYVGLETMNPASLRLMHKHVNINVDVSAGLRSLRAYGISVFASMMLGFDSDTPETAEAMVDFLLQHRVPLLYLYLLTPPPRSELWQELKEAGRLLDVPWFKYDGHHATFRHPTMSPSELEDLFWKTLGAFYSTPSIMKRLLLPPRVAAIIFNFITQRKLRYRLSPWMGLPWSTGVGLAQRLLHFLLESEWVRRVVRRLEPSA